MNRYTILSLVLLTAVILMISFSPADDTVEITGYADNPHENQNGTTFSIKDPQGNETKAFYSGKVDSSLHVFKGRYSEDGNILFVNDID